MSYEQNTAAISHALSLENREKLSISGVEDVKGFDESVVELITSRGALTVRGEGLHIDMIDLELGRLEVRGHVAELSYDESEPRHGFWARLFG